MVNLQLRQIAESYGITKRVIFTVCLIVAACGVDKSSEIITSCEADAESYVLVRHAEKAHRIVDGKGEIYTRTWEEVATEKRILRNKNGRILSDHIPSDEDLIKSDYGYYVRGYPAISSDKYLALTAIGTEYVVDVAVKASLKSGYQYTLKADQYRACLSRLYKKATVYTWYGVVISADLIEEDREKWPIVHLVKLALITLANRCSSVLRLMSPDTTG